MRALGAYIFAGGFTVGVKRVFEVVGHLEGSDYGVASARANWPDLDVRYPKAKWEVDRPELQGLDFIYCNPPCAIFSMMGIRTTRGAEAWRDDPRLECWLDSFELLEKLRPRAWACESVTQIYSTGRPLIDSLTRKALAMGYSVTHLLLDAQWCGLPQSRKRFFLVAHRQPRLAGYQHNFPPPPGARELFAELVESPGYVRPFRPDLGAALRATPPGKRLAGVWEDLNPNFSDNRNPNGTVKGRPSFQDYRLHPERPMGAYIGDKIYHFSEDRLIGINEAKALCGYPQDFKLVCREGPDAGSMLARAVMPPVGEWLARAVAATIAAPEGDGVGERRVTVVDVREPDVEPADITSFYLRPDGSIIDELPEAAFERTGRLPAPVDATPGDEGHHGADDGAGERCPGTSFPLTEVAVTVTQGPDTRLAEETSASSLHGPREPSPAEPSSGPPSARGARSDAPLSGNVEDGLSTSAGGDVIAKIAAVDLGAVERAMLAFRYAGEVIELVSEATGIAPDELRRIRAAQKLTKFGERYGSPEIPVVETISPAGRPEAAPAVRVPSEPVVPPPQLAGAAVLESGSVGTPTEKTVKPRASREPRKRSAGLLEGLTEPLQIDIDGDVAPEPGEPSGHFIKRMILAGGIAPEKMAELVRRRYPDRTTKVGDVYYNYRQMQDGDVPGLPEWPGREKPKKRADRPAAESRMLSHAALVKDPPHPRCAVADDDRRPKLLLTGSTAMQVGSTKTQLKIITAMAAWRSALEALGYAVDHRPVEPGEDLSRYAAVVSALNKPSSISSSHFFGALWALISRPDAVAAVDDWQTADLIAGLKTNSKLEERAFRLFKPPEELRPRLLQAMRDLCDTTRTWPWPVIAPTFRGGDTRLLKLPAKVLPLDPTAFTLRYPKATLEGPPERRWVQASLAEKKLKADAGWPVEHLGFKNRGKGGGGKSGGAAQERVPEPELMSVYARSWGILSPPHPHAGSGWWRVRFLMAADARRVLSCCPAEARVLDGGGGPYSEASLPRRIEKLDDAQLAGLALAQAMRLENVSEPKDNVLEKLSGWMKERAR